MGAAAANDTENGRGGGAGGAAAATAPAPAAPPPLLKGLVGAASFVRHNPRTDKFKVIRFHHVDFWCMDATSTYKRFSWGLGMPLVARSDLSTGNATCSSYVCQSRHLVFAFTAPTSVGDDGGNEGTPSSFSSSSSSSSKCPYPGYSREEARAFVAKHGLAVRAIGVVVEDAREAFSKAVEGGAAPGLEPRDVFESGGDGEVDGDSTEKKKRKKQQQTISEVVLYGDVRLRFVSGDSEAPFLAGYADEPGGKEAAFVTEIASADNDGVAFVCDEKTKTKKETFLTLGLDRLDHAVSNVPVLLPVANAIAAMTGFHEFAEFTAEDVGTVDSGLNSVVLANDAENVLLPVNEPTHGTKRVSQIQTFLEHHGGPGIQHLALKTDDAFATLRELRRRASRGGFELMPPASDEYYDTLPKKLSRPGDGENESGEECPLTPEQLRECRELGLLVDRDDQGVLLQIFTRPLSDRPTVFLEIIQRLGCVRGVPAKEAAERRESAATVAAAKAKIIGNDDGDGEGDDSTTVLEQAGGCGGFGKGNFSELFKSIEDYEKTLDV